MSASRTLRTCKQRWRMSALRGRADMTRAFTISAYNPERTSRTLKARAVCLAFTPVLVPIHVRVYQVPSPHRAYNRSTQYARTCLFLDVALSRPDSSSTHRKGQLKALHP